MRERESNRIQEKWYKEDLKNYKQQETNCAIKRRKSRKKSEGNVRKTLTSEIEESLLASVNEVCEKKRVKL